MERVCSARPSYEIVNEGFERILIVRSVKVSCVPYRVQVSGESAHVAASCRESSCILERPDHRRQDECLAPHMPQEPEVVVEDPEDVQEDDAVEIADGIRHLTCIRECHLRVAELLIDTTQECLGSSVWPPYEVVAIDEPAEHDDETVALVCACATSCLERFLCAVRLFEADRFRAGQGQGLRQCWSGC